MAQWCLKQKSFDGNYHDKYYRKKNGFKISQKISKQLKKFREVQFKLNIGVLFTKNLTINRILIIQTNVIYES